MPSSCNVLTKPHQHLHDSSAWFSIGQHTRGHILVDAECVCSGQGGLRCRMHCLDGLTWHGATYDLAQQPVVVHTGAWHGRCSWHGERQLVVLYSSGDSQTLPIWDRALLHEAAFRLYAGAHWATPRSTMGAMGQGKSAGHSLCWLCTTLQGLLVGSGGHGAQHPQCLDDGGIWRTLW